MKVGNRYSSDNIFAMQETLIAWIKADPEGADDLVYELADWCSAWLANNPRDNGGDGWPRRQMRPDWPNVRADFRRLEAGSER